MAEFINRKIYVGQQVNFLTVVRKARAAYPQTWEVVCICGVIKEIRDNRLLRTLSCGCYRKPRTHEKEFRSEYHIWLGMCERTSNLKDHLYGGRGISVCNRWFKFENFIADMGKRPSPQHSIDRINNDGNYEPNNCRWATSKEQARNRSQNILVLLDGKEVCLIEAVEKLKPPRDYDLIVSRLAKGWPLDKAMFLPKMAGVSYKGRSIIPSIDTQLSLK